MVRTSGQPVPTTSTPCPTLPARAIRCLPRPLLRRSPLTSSHPPRLLRAHSANLVTDEPTAGRQSCVFVASIAQVIALGVAASSAM